MATNMAAGDRKANGKPKDIVRHFSTVAVGVPVCAQKGYGYSTTDFSDVNCIKCRKKVIKDNLYYTGK